MVRRSQEFVGEAQTHLVVQGIFESKDPLVAKGQIGMIGALAAAFAVKHADDTANACPEVSRDPFPNRQRIAEIGHERDLV